MRGHGTAAQLKQLTCAGGPGRDLRAKRLLLATLVFAPVSMHASVAPSVSIAGRAKATLWCAIGMEDCAGVES
eukprot:3492532-Rhodomonas_salina.1